MNESKDEIITQESISKKSVEEIKNNLASVNENINSMQISYEKFLKIQ
jgi:DNA-directed RNA polymerase alpha subunit